MNSYRHKNNLKNHEYKMKRNSSNRNIINNNSNRAYPWSEKKLYGLRNDSIKSDGSVSTWTASTTASTASSSVISWFGVGAGSARSGFCVALEDLKQTFVNVGHLISNFFEGPAKGVGVSSESQSDFTLKSKSNLNSSRLERGRSERSRSRSQSRGRRSPSPTEERGRSRSIRMNRTKSDTSANSVFDDTADVFLNYWIGPPDNDDDTYEERQDRESRRGGRRGYYDDYSVNYNDASGLNMRRFDSSRTRSNSSRNTTIDQKRRNKDRERSHYSSSYDVKGRSSSFNTKPNVMLKRGLSSKLEKKRLKRTSSSFSQQSMISLNGGRIVGVVNSSQRF